MRVYLKSISPSVLGPGLGLNSSPLPQVYYRAWVNGLVIANSKMGLNFVIQISVARDERNVKSWLIIRKKEPE